MTADAQCPRCPGQALEVLSTGDPAFFACPACGRHFRRTENGGLVERWLGPLSLVLYPVIFAERPQESAERVAAALHASVRGERSGFRPITDEELRQLLDEIRLELDRPSQKVRAIHDLRADEADLREYLALVAERLEGLLDT